MESLHVMNTNGYGSEIGINILPHLVLCSLVVTLHNGII